jgi:hypothetical protein
MVTAIALMRNGERENFGALPDFFRGSVCRLHRQMLSHRSQLSDRRSPFTKQSTSSATRYVYALPSSSVKALDEIVRPIV